jgi:hypothetical protein
MSATASIFFDIQLPNWPTWFYFSGLLAVALFFKFTRLVSVRNLDVPSLFLPMPGLLLLIEGGSHNFWGYLWLLGASLYFLVRCLLDLTLVRRPALGANLDLAGLMWLAAALFVSLIAVAVQKPSESPLAALDSGAVPAPTDKVRGLIEAAGKPYAPPDVDDSSLNLWVERGLAVLCHLSIVVGLALVGWYHFNDPRAGVSAATFYLLLPYTYLLLPASPLRVGRWDHAWPMALMVWAVFTYRRPTLAGAFLGLAAGSAFFPVVTLPAWLGFYRQRGAGRFALSFALSAGTCLSVLGAVLWLNGELPSSLRSAWAESDWQPWKQPHPETRGFWQDLPSLYVPRIQWAYRMPVFLAWAALVVTTGFWPSPKNLAHVLALSAAVLVGIQFWYPDRGGVYLLWYLPFLLLLVFRPNLSDSQPPVPAADDWLARLGRRLRRRALRLVRLVRHQQPAARVP